MYELASLLKYLKLRVIKMCEYKIKICKFCLNFEFLNNFDVTFWGLQTFFIFNLFYMSGFTGIPKLTQMYILKGIVHPKIWILSLCCSFSSSSVKHKISFGEKIGNQTTLEAIDFYLMVKKYI